MQTAKKVYDFSFDKVRSQVTGALKRHGNAGTVADVVGLSGLPKYQVETVLPAVVADCRGQMAVTESGEILYKFPRGFANAQSSLGKTLLKWTGKALAALFKAWIVVMLVGYFALFVVILLAAIAVSIALSFAKRGDDRDSEGGGVLGFYLVTRVIEFFVLLWLYSGDPVERQRKKRKPFHKAVFEFVFGVEEKPEVRGTAERKAFVALVRRNKGSVSLEELMALTGKGRGEADAFVSRLLLEFEGEPKVTEGGTLYFWFPELLKTTGGESTVGLADQDLIPFTRNPAGTNRWIVFLNGFNLLLGGYFLAFGLQGFDAVRAAGDNLGIVYLITNVLLTGFTDLSTGGADAVLTAVLGVVPVLYSAFFFGIPFVRRLQEKARNFAIQTNNLRRRLVAAVLAKPTEVRLSQVEPDGERSAPGRPGAERERLKEGLLRDLAGDRSVDVVSADPPVFAVADLEREQRDLAEVRRSTDLTKLALGKVVFDTEDKV